MSGIFQHWRPQPEPKQGGAGETPSKLNDEVTMHATQVHEANRRCEISYEISPPIADSCIVINN